MMNVQQKILVLGSNGQLGSELKELHNLFPDYKFIFADRSSIDISDNGSFDKIVSLQPNFVINAAAYTAVDKAETEVQEAMNINAFAVGFIAKACKQINAVLLHISSDYVYHGNYTMPMKENFETKPKNIYAISKLNGEKLAQQFNDKTIIIRASWIYSIFQNNFVKTMLKLSETRSELSIVHDQIGAPTNAKDLANAIMQIVDYIKINPSENVYGIYNYANEGTTNWMEFAAEIFRIKNRSVLLKGISTEAYNAPALRPKWSVMNLDKIKNTFKLQIPHWKESLEKMLSQL